ncbi:hypothetical protein RCL_jg19113.t1 [Rhizophagus clarus]|uniref:Uncharacterized protein n=1 Tax=Rhizophagus clarus TaxID=94130 RepID=A0A8H3LXK5_9GLOM|nr:hypothetical protein RCL_jg19113.t1 [Rhizophagus clarus]
MITGDPTKETASNKIERHLRRLGWRNAQYSRGLGAKILQDAGSILGHPRNQIDIPCVLAKDIITYLKQDSGRGQRRIIIGEGEAKSSGIHHTLKLDMFRLMLDKHSSININLIQSELIYRNYL